MYPLSSQEKVGVQCPVKSECVFCGFSVTLSLLLGTWAWGLQELVVCAGANTRPVFWGPLCAGEAAWLLDLIL